MPSVLTDQAIAFGDGALRETEVASMLGTVDRQHVFTLLEALLDDEPAAALASCAQMAEQGIDFAAAVDELCSVLHRCAIAQAVPEAVDREFGDAERVIALAARMIAEDVQLFHELAQGARSQIADATNPRAAFEMLALRLLAFRPVEVLDPSLTADDLVTAPAPPAQEVSDPGKKPEPPPAARLPRHRRRRLSSRRRRSIRPRHRPWRPQMGNCPGRNCSSAWG
jgi:DNA polymerase-3 subunit gamma/tau